jgi:hypothetical protein
MRRRIDKGKAAEEKGNKIESGRKKRKLSEENEGEE